jgi:energy-coupling factor transport system permease protein
VRLGAVPGAIVLASLGATALVAEHLVSVAAIAGSLLVVCLGSPSASRRLYVFGALSSGLLIFFVSPLLWSGGGVVLFSGPIVPVIGPLDVTTEELYVAALNGLRLAALGLAFTAYALLLDHDQLVAAAAFARRSALAVALATRLVPTLERDAAGLAEAVRGRGIAVDGARGYARLLSPLVAGSLERAWNLAEAMEARGYGRDGATRAPRPSWSGLDRSAVAAAAAFVVLGLLWL